MFFCEFFATIFIASSKVVFNFKICKSKGIYCLHNFVNPGVYRLLPPATKIYSN